MKKLCWITRALCLALLLGVTWVINVYHLGVFPRPIIDKTPAGKPARWIDKKEVGIHQLILEGTPYERGLAAGKVTADLLQKEESVLIHQFNGLFPNLLFRKLFEVGVIRWFWGIEKFFEPWMVEEMSGVSESASTEFDYLGDRFTRQVAYHGLHEVGQTMVDVGLPDFACTVIALPHQDKWIVGRNFDFEGGRIFDSEKIMKWVFPDQGYPFVSIIWAGMVGAVTGVNNQGVYLSINAAGSRDFRRYGIPSTLVLLKALQFSKNAQEAIHIIASEQMFITDIFVVTDKSGEFYRIEKSPLHTEVIPLKEASVVTNHLISPRWANDSINVYRRDELMSAMREARGKELVTQTREKTLSDPPLTVLSILRDKKVLGGKLLPLGNRKAIDALIATHSVIYDATTETLFVSEGPSLVGSLIGFDLQESFNRHEPKMARTLPSDPDVSPELYKQVKSSVHLISEANQLLKAKDCSGSLKVLNQADQTFSNSSAYFTTLGDMRKCAGDKVTARIAWQKALELSPAYPREVRELERRLAE